MKIVRRRTKSLILLVTLTLILSLSLFLAFSQQPTIQNTLTFPTQTTSTIATGDSKLGAHLQQLLQSSQPSTEYELIIFFQKTVNYAQGIALLKDLGDFQIISNYTILNGICIRAPIAMAETIAQQNYVSSITYNEKIKLLPNQLTSSEITSKDTGVNAAIGADKLQTLYGLNGSGVVVAVLDSGINPHADLPGDRIIYNESFVTGQLGITDDLDGHGTAVAGIIGASGINNPAAKGIAPAVEFLNLRVLDENGEGLSDWLISAINEALDNTSHLKADIITMSLGSVEGTSDDPMSVRANYAWLNDVIVVAAAGNEGGSAFDVNYETINSPGLAAYIITVGSASGFNYGSVSSFSSRGPTDDDRSKPDIVAPGVNILTLDYLNSTDYIYFSGTSASTPVVSGAIALLLDSNSGLSGISPNTTKAALMMTAKDLGLNPFSQGTGLINISRSYDYLKDYYINANVATPPLIITPLRAITTPMTLSDLYDTALNLTIVVGNATRTPIINAYFSVSGNASGFIASLPSTNFTLNDEQVFAIISFRAPTNFTASNFTGNLTLVNGTGEELFTIPLSLTSVMPSWIYLLPTFLGGLDQTANLLLIGGIAGVATICVIGLIAGISRRRKPEAPPEYFEPGWDEFPPPPPPPDWFY